MAKKRKTRKIIKKIMCMLSIVFFFTMATGIMYYQIITSDQTIDKKALASTLESSNLEIFDSEGKEINFKKKNNKIKIEELNKHTIDAFVTSEDRNFFKHKGLDIKRIIGALINNIKNKKLSQGGSTISQQLIKNTHLTNEKTLNRKLKEIKLTKELEKKYTKNKILEMYLNCIYFGNGQYGINDASNYYFGKNAKNLNLAESAILAGIIKNPKNNEPIKNYQKSIKNKNNILKNMLKLGKINKNEFKNAELFLVNIFQNTSTYNQFIESTIIEAKNILNTTTTNLLTNNYKIYTNYNSNLNKKLYKIINSNQYLIKNNNETPCIETIIVDNQTKNVIAYQNNKQINLKSNKRQPGSLIKPILVYAPAFEYEIIKPETKLLDKETSFDEYKPKNYNNTYYGWVTTKEAISKSLNVPAVKTLSYTGFEKARKVSNNLGISLKNEENHLALALGGMKYGCSAHELANAYSCFGTNGTFCQTNYINSISQNNQTIFNNKTNKKQAIKQETANYINECLNECATNGTAKKLKNMDIKTYSKTGTTNNNTDAWNACYTTKYTIITHYFNLSNKPLNMKITGATHPTLINRELLKYLYYNNN